MANIVFCECCGREIPNFNSNFDVCEKCGRTMCDWCSGALNVDVCLDCETYGFGW